MDFDSYWTPAALEELDKFATDDRAQFEYYRSVGYFKTTPAPYADLGQIAAGLLPGRESDNERTMSMNLGLALEDVVTGVRIVERAREKGIGVHLPL